MRLLTLVIVVISLRTDLYGQSPFAVQLVVPPSDPLARRALRDRAAAYAGSEARPLIESSVGDEASLALLKCSPTVAANLSAFYTSGGLSRVCYPQKMLLCIAQLGNGDKVCSYIVTHEIELSDCEFADVFLANPLEFSLQLKDLPVAAVEIRAQRTTSTGSSRLEALLGKDRSWTMWVGVAVLIGIFLWRRRR